MNFVVFLLFGFKPLGKGVLLMSQSTIIIVLQNKHKME